MRASPALALQTEKVLLAVSQQRQRYRELCATAYRQIAQYLLEICIADLQEQYLKVLNRFEQLQATERSPTRRSIYEIICFIFETHRSQADSDRRRTRS